MMSSTGPPKKLAKMSSNINNNNNSNNSSSSACNCEQSLITSLNDKPFLIKKTEEHLNKKLKLDFNSISTDNYGKYLDKKLINLSIRQKTVLESRIVLDKQFAKQSLRNLECMKKLDVLMKLKKETEQKENENKKLIHEIQEELLQTNQQIKQKDDELFSLHEQLSRIKKQTIKLLTVSPKRLDVNTSDKQCDTNHESVASHLLTSHPSTANAIQNNNVVTALPSMPDLNASNESPTDSIAANLEKIFESPKRAPEESQSICNDLF